jgi:peptidyl-tRNA hydrolase
MEDHNSPQAVANRASQEDPIVMYLIVKESLGMGVGKTAAQCAHASQMLQLNFNDTERKELCGWATPSDVCDIHLFNQWLDTSFRKVVLRAKDKEWQKIKEACPNHVVVVDAGLTEIAAGSETVIGLWPMYKSQVPKIITKLQALK